MREAMFAQRAARDHGAGTVPTVHNQLLVLAGGNDVDPPSDLPERDVDSARHVPACEFARGTNVEDRRGCVRRNSRKKRSGRNASGHAVRAPAGTGTNAAATASAATSADNT
jgi:hypothetical protein